MATPQMKPTNLTDQFASSSEPIQPQLSNKAFKFLYSWEDMRQRVKKAEWLYAQATQMMERNEKIEEIEKLVTDLESQIVNLAEFYRSRYRVKIGYINNQLKEIKKESK